MKLLRLLRFVLVSALTSGVAALPARAGEVRIASAPNGETLSVQYSVTVEGKSCPVYAARVAPVEPERRWKGMDDKRHSADFYGMASFVSFDMQGEVEITVTCPAGTVASAKVLPGSFGITPVIRGRTVTLKLAEPKPLTLEVNGDWAGSLHLFANPFETDVPSPTTRTSFTTALASTR